MTGYIPNTATFEYSYSQLYSHEHSYCVFAGVFVDSNELLGGLPAMAKSSTYLTHFGSSTRAAENRTRWKGIVANSSVVP